MQTPEWREPNTSLELTFETSPNERADPPAPTDLELPPSGTAPTVMDTAAKTDAAEPIASGVLGTQIVAHFRQAETAMLGRILITALSEALPGSMTRLERRRSLGQRIARRTAEPIGITITAGDRTLAFRAPEDGVAEAEIGHSVRGVMLSSTPVPVDRWLDELASLLNQLSSQDDATRAALEKTLLS